MSAESAAVHAGEAEHGDGAERFLQHHFQDLEVQSQAARLGMWLFLATEILLFGGLFIGFGTRLGNGCTSGHGIFGMSNFERSSFVTTLWTQWSTDVTWVDVQDGVYG